MNQPRLYGLMAEFSDPRAVLEAARQAYSKGYRDMDAYSPFPVEGLAEAVGFRHTRLPLFVLVGGIVGALAGFFLQYYTATMSYPLNVGGRPLNSWPSFIPITFEATVLIAALCAVVGMLARNGLPRPYHPVFNVQRFERVTRDKFFLCIEATDPLFDEKKTRNFLESLKPTHVSSVDP
jgi:hypothetical protein